MSGNTAGTPPALRHNLKHNQVLHERNHPADGDARSRRRG